MEYRIHPRNGKKLSTIGINSYNWISFDDTKKKDQIISILSTALENKINLFSLYSFYPESLKIFSKWYKLQSNTDSIYISLTVGYSNEINSFHEFKENQPNLSNNNVKNIHEKVISLMEKYSLDKIDFLNLFNINMDDFKDQEFLKEFDLLKRNKSILSIGISSAHYADAIALAKSQPIDHLLVKLNLFTSPDLVKTLVSFCEENSIALFCTEPLEGGLLTSFENSGLIMQKYIEFQDKSPLLELITKGKLEFSENLSELFTYSEAKLNHFALRYLLDIDVNSVLIGVESSAQIIDNLKALKLPLLTENEKLGIQNIIDFENYYDSPKRGEKRQK